jgi:hypothetical protein
MSKCSADFFRLGVKKVGEMLAYVEGFIILRNNMSGGQW